MAAAELRDERDDGFKRVLVLAKVRDILDLFTLDEPELDIRRIRELSGLPNSTALRLVRNMVADGLLAQSGNRYRIGLAVLRWAAVARQGLGLLETATPVLVALREQTGETAALAVRDGVSRVCIGLSESTRAVGRRITLGNVLPVHVGSAGKTLLAFDKDATRLLEGRTLESMTSRTVADRESLERELEIIRRDGYAVSRGEWDLDVAGVAAPVFAADGHIVAAVGISAPASRLTDETLPAATRAVVSAAAEISEGLGFVARRPV